MDSLSIIALLGFSFILGALPIPRWLFKQLTGLDLKTVGTGNVSVSAAFIQGGTFAGLCVVLVEMSRGLLPVVLAFQLDLPPAWQILSLIPLVLGRYWFSQGGGVTNVSWGILLYAPKIALAAGLTGIVIWGITRSRRWAARLGCFSAAVWLWLWWPSWSEVVALLILATLVIVINLIQADDVTQMKQMLPLKAALDPSLVGEKSARLAQLLQAGFQIPHGYVLCPEEKTPWDLDQVARQIQPQPSAQQVWIVRSSALGEDADSSSSAGQYQTLAHITSVDQLKQAIRECQASYQSPQAQRYRQQRQISESGIAILLQRQIQGVVSGVAFSRNPLDGKAQIVIEALPGGAAAVVSGQQTPEHLELNPEHLSDQLQAQSLLPAPVLETLVTQIQQIEAFFHGIPQDIEWTWDGERLWILQSRPITTLRPIWTRTIAAEVIPGVIPPLTWSINRPLTCGVWGEIFTIVLGSAVDDLDFTQTATLLGSHAYFNATLLGAIFRQMGLPEQGLEFLVRQQKMGKPPRSAYQQLLKCLPGLWRLIQRDRNLKRDFNHDQREYFQTALQVLEQQALSRLTTYELVALTEQIQDLLKRATFYNIVGPIGFAIRRSIFKVADEWLQDQTSPERQALEQLRNLATTLRQLLDPTLTADQQRSTLQTLMDMEEISTQFHAILQTYGFLSEVGTDIAVPCWQEQPDTIRQTVINLALQPESKGAVTTPPLNQWQRLRAAWCQQRLDLKGEIAAVYGQLLAHLRWTFLELEQRWLQAELLDQPGDIFFLEFEQVQEIVQYDPAERQLLATTLKATLAQRRQQWLKDQERLVPTVVYGSVLPQDQPVTLDPSETCLVGIPASRGEVEGIVKIIKRLDGNQELDENTIVVVPYTDAGWAPLLLGAKAIIAEVGGQLSHGAIVAREYGIPAVMNVDQATRRLQEGQRVRVDGYYGTVEILSGL